MHIMTPVGVAVYRDYESSSRLVAVASFPQTGQRWREVQGSLDTQPGGFSAEELQNLGGMSLDQLLADSSEAGSRARKALADDAAIRQLRPNPPAKGASGMDVRAFRISVEGPMDRFLLRHSSAKNIELFQRLSARLLKAQGLDESAVSPTVRRFAVHAPAFVATELTEAFIIGLLIFIPFVVIDLVVSSILLSVGMPGLSPGMVSLPLKLLVFVMMNGWGLIMRGLVLGYA
ncbi:MAG: EscR/YscR/HrcR family type III secretion system export apparatus protein [Phycisphaerales bacterium]|nr:EscR/YscR/HrcR family type III secretion system export apparatus protein [Phycisphaerales bacterium]